MKLVRVVGFRSYSGEFEGKAYSGYYVHGVTDGQDRGITGDRVMEIKVRSKLNYTPRVGDQIYVTYDESGIAAIEVASV